ncbi:hypothetical protein [Pseudoramibacter faecis]|uniref:hypothetical protein n=1 Tax=Pseudoramibacter faecis TaxID=3108534 RepID=UPI002E76AD71|nr:hypothetical protein [Pseudoramibacter sp. HA2172]
MAGNLKEEPTHASEASSRQQIVFASVVGMFGVMVCAVLIALSVILKGLPQVARVAMILWGIAVLIADTLVAANLDRKAGSFECAHCHHRFTPALGAYLKAIHGRASRRLVCPACGRRGRCAHRLTKSGKL